jgi:hypothetical protein
MCVVCHVAQPACRSGTALVTASELFPCCSTSRGRRTVAPSCCPLPTAGSHMAGLRNLGNSCWLLLWLLRGRWAEAVQKRHKLLLDSARACRHKVRACVLERQAAARGGGAVSG